MAICYEDSAATEISKRRDKDSQYEFATAMFRRSTEMIQKEDVCFALSVVRVNMFRVRPKAYTQAEFFRDFQKIIVKAAIIAMGTG